MKNLNLRRVGAYVLDILIIGLISSLISMIPFLNSTRNDYNNRYEDLISLTKDYEDKEISEKEYRERYTPISYDLNRLNVNYVIIDCLVILAYFGIFQWQMKGQTIGKKLLKVRVVLNKDGNQPGFLNFLIRTIILNNVLITITQLAVITLFNAETYYSIYNNVNLVGYILLYVIVFLILVRQDSRGLHDLIAGTKVVMIPQDNMDKAVSNEPVAKEMVEEIKIIKPKKETVKAKKSTKSSK